MVIHGQDQEAEHRGILQNLGWLRPFKETERSMVQARIVSGFDEALYL